ncbi:MAG: ABC transporter permease [Clostridiales bacterium]|nr:ABC transporter permease [Clostridiales bacterium]
MEMTAHKRVFKWLKENNIILVIILVFAVAAFVGQPKFLKVSNQFNLLQSIATYGTIAMGLTFIFLVGSIDLSIGQQVSFDAVVMVMATNTFGLVPGIIITLIVGIILGYTNGSVVTRLEITPLIATLAVMTILKGCVLSILGDGNMAINVKGLSSVYNYKLFGFLYPSVIVALIMLAAGAIFMTKTRTGINMYIIGGNHEAGALSGVNPPRLTRIAFTIGGFCAAVCSILLVFRLGTSTYNFGDNIDITAICAVVIGGVSMAGGKGSMAMCILGVGVIQIINNVMNKLGLHAAVQALVTGIVVIAVLIVDKYTSEKSKAKSAAA